jgi:hypothetical protein
MVDPWELACNYALCTWIVIYIFFTIYWVMQLRLFQSTCFCWNQFNKILVRVVLEFTTVLLLSIFICRFYGRTGSGHAGQAFILPKNFWAPFFLAQKYLTPLLFHQPPSAVINDRSLTKKCTQHNNRILTCGSMYISFISFTISFSSRSGDYPKNTST